MNSSNNGLGNRKWIYIFLYQYLVPILLIAVVAIYAGLKSSSFGLVLFQVAFDGQLSLISILLIVSTALELQKIRRRNDGFALIDLWLPFVIPLLVLYGSNKVEGIKWVQSIYNIQREIGPVQIYFAASNVFLLIASPIYCFFCVRTTHTTGRKGPKVLSS